MTKELLHNDDRPPYSGPTEAKRLCDDFVNFFNNEKLKKIAGDIRGRLHSAPAYYRQMTRRQVPLCLDVLA